MGEVARNPQGERWALGLEADTLRPGASYPPAIVAKHAASMFQR